MPLCRSTLPCGHGANNASGRSPAASSPPHRAPSGSPWWLQFSEEESSGAWPCSSSRTPPPWSCPSSDPLRYGAFSRTGPWRRSSAHAATWRGAVALSPLGGSSVCAIAHVLPLGFGQRGSRPHEGSNLRQHNKRRRPV